MAEADMEVTLSLSPVDIPGADLTEPFDRHTIPKLRWWVLSRGIKAPTSWKNKHGCSSWHLPHSKLLQTIQLSSPGTFVCLGAVERHSWIFCPTVSTHTTPMTRHIKHRLIVYLENGSVYEVSTKFLVRGKVSTFPRNSLKWHIQCSCRVAWVLNDGIATFPIPIIHFYRATKDPNHYVTYN